MIPQPAHKPAIHVRGQHRPASPASQEVKGRSPGILAPATQVITTQTPRRAQVGPDLKFSLISSSLLLNLHHLFGIFDDLYLLSIVEPQNFIRQYLSL